METPSPSVFSIKEIIFIIALSVSMGSIATYVFLSSTQSTQASISTHTASQQSQTSATTQDENSPYNEATTSLTSSTSDTASTTAPKISTHLHATFITTPDVHDIHAPIQLFFDHPVEEKSVEKLFTITPKAQGTFSLNGSLLTFTPTRLQNQTTYTVTMASGASSSNALPSEAGSTLTFTTNPEIIKLNVPYFAQQYENSCEASALRMVLAYYGITTTDMDIVKKFGYNPKPKDIINNSWDDPQKMFVGSVNNEDGLIGYGVYGKPVARVANEYGRNATYIETIITPEYLAHQIKLGYPAILWGYTSLTTAPYTWTTPDGTTVKAFKGEHARVVVGFEGSETNPLGFYVHDPETGSAFEFWDPKKLVDQVYAVQGVTNQAVVVR